jgi:hypothetical protein
MSTNAARAAQYSRNPDLWHIFPSILYDWQRRNLSASRAGRE